MTDKEASKLAVQYECRRRGLDRYTIEVMRPYRPRPHDERWRMWSEPHCGEDD